MAQDVRQQLVVSIPPHAPNPQLVQLHLESKVGNNNRGARGEVAGGGLMRSSSLTVCTCFRFQRQTQSREFYFDRAFPPTTTQVRVFEKTCVVMVGA